MSTEIFDSSIRSVGDMAGVFEYDGQAGYFYLYDVHGDVERKIIDTIRIVVGPVKFVETDIRIAWNANEDQVGLYIGEVLWALFDTIRKQKYGGDYQNGGVPAIPTDVTRRFDT